MAGVSKDPNTRDFPSPTRELAETVARILEYPGTIHWDATQPDGTPRKLMDTTRLNSLGWSPKIPLEDGIRGAYQDFLKQA